MENENTTQPEVEVTQNEAKVETQTTTTNVENKKEAEKTYSQSDLDRNAADTRRATEREVKRKILAELGLKEGEEEKLSAYKQAYDDSLSDEERKAEELEQLQSDNIDLLIQIEEKDYTIAALTRMTGKKPDEVEKIVRMARGLKTEDNTIEEAIEEVMSMIKVEPTTPATTMVNENMPKGQEIAQPSTSVQINTDKDNPFKAGTINLTKQGELIRTNPELAKRLANEAGVRLSI